HRLQGREDAPAVHPRAWQDPAAPHFRHLRAAPAQAAERHQARTHRGAAAVHRGLSRHASMIDTSLQQSEPVALPHRSPGRVARSVAGYSLLMALMIMLAFPVFVPAVVLYCGIRYGTRSAAVALLAATVIATASIALGGYPQDVTRFAYAFAAGAALTLGVPALAAIPFVRRGESFGSVLMLLIIAGAFGMVVTEVLFRVAGGYSPYALHVTQEREAVAKLIAAYAANGMPLAAVQMAQRWGTY